MTSYKEWPSDGGPHTSDSIGQALAGLVARDSDGNPIEGMIAPPTVTAVGGAWKVQVSRFVYVRDVAGSARFSPLSASEQHDIANASTIPVGQSRIDRVVWDPIAGVLDVVTGVPGASPVLPGIGANKPVARVRVQAGDAQVVQARITPDFDVAMIAGLPRVYMENVSARSVPRQGGVDVYITFPDGMFSGPPNVQFTTLAGTRGARSLVVSRTATTCQVVLINDTGTAQQIGGFLRAEQM